MSSSFPETYLYRLWFSGFLNGKTFFSDLNEEIRILSLGTKNQTNGPDVLNTELEIDGKRKSGAIEFHVSMKEWYEHNHHLDPVYNSVFLHFSFENSTAEKTVRIQNDHYISNVTLSSVINFDELLSVLTLADKINFQEQIPCASQIHSISQNLKLAWLTELGHQVFIQKVNRVADRLKELTQNPNYPIGKRYVWDQLLYEGFFRALGYPYNKENFELLAKSTPVSEWNESDHFHEELLDLWLTLGGLNEEISDRSVLKKSDWKTGSVYAVNQPVNRLKSASQIIQKFIKSGFLKPLIIHLEAHLNMNSKDTKILTGLLNLLKSDQPEKSGLGKQKRESVLFNTWFPVLYLYAKTFNRNDLQKLILDCCDHITHSQQISAEEKILDSLGITERLFSVQWGGLELSKNWCAEKKCLQCRIGKEILSAR